MNSKLGYRPFQGPMVLFIAALILATTTGCQGPEPPIRVATLPWAPYDLIHLVSRNELLEQEGVQLVEFQTPAEVVRAFRYDLVDAMLVTSHFALSTITERSDIRIIYVIDVSLGADALLTKPAIENVDDLRGARIGVEAAPLGSYMLLRALDELGLESDEVEKVNIDTPDQADAFQSGEIDALITYDPTRTKLLAEGANQLFSSEQIPYEIIDVLVTRSDVVDERAEALENLVDTMNRGLLEFRDNPSRGAGILAERHDMAPAAILDALQSVDLFSLEDNQRILDAKSGPVYEGLVDQCEVMIRHGLLVTQPSLDPLLDRRIIEGLLEE